MSVTARPDWRTLAPALLTPTVVLGAVQGATVPMLPVVATELGAGLAQAGVVAGLMVVSQLAGSLPAGWAVDRIGERRAMLLAAAVMATGLMISLLARSPLALAVGVSVAGLAQSTFQIARQALVTVLVPLSHRARALSTLAGGNRLGMLVGPFLATGVIALSGETRWVFALAIALVAGGAVAVMWLPDPEEHLGPRDRDLPRAGVVETVVRNRAVLVRLGTMAMTLQAMRQARYALLPLWGVSLGLDARTIALVLACAAALDFALFYPGGMIMDRWGRLWIGVPGLLGFATAWFVLSGSGLVGADGVGWFVAAALGAGLANGITSGFVATIGSDVADQERPATFLSVWQLTSNAGGAASPMAISALTAWASLSVAALALGFVGVAGAAMALYFVPRHLPADA